MLPDYWNTTCSWCKVVFQQRRQGTPGARAKICDRKICSVGSNWRRNHNGSPPSWLVAKWRLAYGESRRPERIATEHKKGVASEEICARREQAEFMKGQHDAWVTRVRRVAADNPDMSWELLGERFGVDGTCIRRACPDIPRERDWFCVEKRRSA